MSNTNGRTDEIKQAEAVEDAARKKLETTKARWEALSSNNDTTTTTMCGSLLDQSNFINEDEIALSNASHAVRTLKVATECSTLKGGRRRRSRKHTKKHRKTRCRHHKKN